MTIQVKVQGSSIDLFDTAEIPRGRAKGEFSMGNQYYSDRYKQVVRGDALCGFWSRMDNGVCMGWPGGTPQPCPANANGAGCPVFALLEFANVEYILQTSSPSLVP